MANVYARLAKIKNAVGRSDYITDEERQEEIVLHKENMQYSWQEHSLFEKAHQKTNVANNEALEVHIALPNELAHEKEKLEQVCDALAHDIVGENKDHEYAVHWNHNRTNLHVHILFSERENQLELEPKIYKRDIYYNFEEKRLSKKNDSKAEIIHHKGEVQRDKDGNIKYQSDVFKSKDTRYIAIDWVEDIRKIVQSVFKKNGYELGNITKESPYLAQKKLYKGAGTDYLEKAKAWNTEVQQYNESVKQHIAIEQTQVENYYEIKKQILENVKEANKEEKKITPRAIQLVNDMASWVHRTLLILKVFAKKKSKEKDILNKWETIKIKYSDLFQSNKNLENENKRIKKMELENDDECKKLESDIQIKEKEIEELNELISAECEAYYELGFTEDEYTNEVNGLSIDERYDRLERIVEQLEKERRKKDGYSGR